MTQMMPDALESRTISIPGDGRRLDVALSEAAGLTRSRVAALMVDGNVTVDGKVETKSGAKAKPGQTVVLMIPAPKPAVPVAQEIPLTILYQDDDLAVVLKPCGMVVHPAAGNEDGTLVNALLHHLDHLSGIGGELRPGIVHRIDKDTSGLLVVAKDDATHIGLSQQMAVHSVERAYHTIVYGGFAQDEGFVESNLGRSKTDRKKMAVYPASEPHTKYAYTGYQVLERLNNFTMLECRLKTGRTHQIRVHMASIHHPVAGDPVYGPHNCITSLHGQCLHAKTLGFVHPITGEHLRFDSELPDYFTRFLTTLRQRTGGNNE
jgi:23S rRNA pseudouridine1911/1915/1917 synthase